MKNEIVTIPTTDFDYMVCNCGISPYLFQLKNGHSQDIEDDIIKGYEKHLFTCARVLEYLKNTNK